MFAVIPVQFAFAVHYFVVWPIAATLQCCFPISFPTLPKQVLAVCYILSFCNIFTSCGTLQLICLPFCVTVLYQRRVCGVSLSIPAFRLHCPLSIALYCIALHCPPLFVSHLLSSLDWPWGYPVEIFHSLDFANMQLGGGPQGYVLVHVRISSFICFF